MPLRTHNLVVTTDVSGDGTKQTDHPILGKLYMVKWKDGTLGNGVDAVLSIPAHGDAPARTLLTLTDADNDAEYMPRQQGQGPTGTNIAGVYDMPIVDGPLLLTVSSGSPTATGGMEIFIEENI